MSTIEHIKWSLFQFTFSMIMKNCDYEKFQTSISFDASLYVDNYAIFKHDCILKI